MNTRSLIIASVIGGLVMALLFTIPIINFINCLFCAGAWLGGGFGVWFYRRSEGKLPLTAGQGAVIGAISGIFGAILAAIFGSIFGGATLASLAAADPSGTLEDAIGGAALAGGLSLLGLLFNIFIYPVFGAIGGAAAAVIFNRPTPAV